ncbi:IS4 family transposase [Rickettsia endosymbiont of Nabis limbatus]|uniref:IS4 family transposase n=1 Tax=Rickettsia endosymbiont of Nabis limbatus TaxID=3066268 RepID=UPI003AF3951C
MQDIVTYGINISSTGWLENELRHVDFKDKRLINRLIKTSNLLDSKASGTINQSCRSWKDAKGAYRLFSNDKFDIDEVYSSHHVETQNRIQGKNLVFAIQDTTYLDYDTHIKTKGLGSISKAYTKHKQGLIMHSTIIVTPGGLPLGLTSQQCWARIAREEDQKEKARRKYITHIKDKESYKWINAFEETIANIPENTRVITVGDREADIFDLLWKIEESAAEFVIRNRQDRKFICPENGKTKIQTKISKLQSKKEIRLKIPGNGLHKARKANVEIKYTYGHIPIRSVSLYGPENTDHKISDKLAVYVVSAKEINAPVGVEAIDWTILTNIPVSSFEDAVERITWYKLRWKIEEYFRVLKSGCKIEASRLSAETKLQKLIAIKSLIAFKILYLSKIASTCPEESCDSILTTQEWKTLYMRVHRTNNTPGKPPNIKEAIILLGKLGGFMARKSDGLPGAMSLWRGYEILQESVMMLSIVSGKICG